MVTSSWVRHDHQRVASQLDAPRPESVVPASCQRRATTLGATESLMQRFKAIFDFSPSRPSAAEAAGHTCSTWRGTSSAAQRHACEAPKLRPQWQAGAPPPAPRRRLPFSPRLLRPAPCHAPAAALVDKHIMSPRGGDNESGALEPPLRPAKAAALAALAPAAPARPPPRPQAASAPAAATRCT